MSLELLQNYNSTFKDHCEFKCVSNSTNIHDATNKISITIDIPQPVHSTVKTDKYGNMDKVSLLHFFY